jgi:hypothetical protein
MESSKVFQNYLSTADNEDQRQKLVNNQMNVSVSDNFSINDEKNINKLPTETYQE